MSEKFDYPVVFINRIVELYYKCWFMWVISLLIMCFLPTIWWLICHLISAALFFGLKCHSKDKGHWLLLGFSWLVVISNFPAFFYLLIEDCNNDRRN